MMRYRNPQLQDKLAAAYVMGSMSKLTRQRFKRLLSEHPEISLRVDAWQARLSPLNQDIEAIEPPPQVWQKIDSQLPKTHMPTRRRLFAFAASLLIMASLWLWYQAPSRYSVDIRDPQQQLEWHIQADTDNRQLIISTHRVPKLPPGQHCVLWISSRSDSGNGKAKLVTPLSDTPGTTRVKLDKLQIANLEQSLVTVSIENRDQHPDQPTRANIVFSGGWQ